MWYLTSEHDLRVLYVVPQKSEIIIGRNPDGDIFANVEDRSISRQHASLTLNEDGLFLQDLGSRYGTYINDSTDKLEVGHSAQLNDNDVVKFGKLNWEWRVHKLSLNTCTSTLKGENLQNVRTILQKLGGIVKGEWDETCLYLTMPVITLTIKVVLALVQSSHIVTTEFWNKCLETVNKHGKLPNPEHFTPQIVESTLNKEVVSFLPNQNRKVIFMNKKFIFFSKRQFEMYKQVLVKTSAEPQLLSESKFTKSMLCDQDVVVIQYNMSNISQDTQSQKNQINEIISYLKSKEKRVVAESEIGLAILYCSTDKYCNPDFNLSNEVTKQTLEKKSFNILAQESQELSTLLKKENIVINESLASFDVCSTSVKRKLSEVTDDIEITNANKKLAIVASNPDIEGTNKRKLNEDNPTSDNPNKKLAMDQSVSESEDFFNLIKSVDNEIKQTDKKLNLSKPTKRKADVQNDDDLFNFIQLSDKPKEKSNKTIDPSKQLNNKRTDIIKIDIKAMRGVKLPELVNKSNWESNVPTIKKEFNELDRKMNELNLGTTVVTVRKDLIIKKEIIEIEGTPQSRNFKKFKKVWPLKMQVTIVPKS